MELLSQTDSNYNSIADRVKNILTTTVCEEAGLVPILINQKKICLGAMNPTYPKVKLIEKKIFSTVGIPVDIQQISASDWERWFEEGNRNLNNINPPNLLGDITEKPDSAFPLEATNKPMRNNNKDKLIDSQKSINERTLTIEEKSTEEEYMSNAKIVSNENDIDDNNIEFLDHVDDDSDHAEDEQRIIYEDICESSDPLIAGVASILNKCFHLKASDVHVEPLEEKLRIRYRIDGILNEFYSLNKSLVNPVISRIKIMSRLDIAEKRLPQDGRIRCILKGKICDFRVSTLPGKWGEKVVLRALESDTSILDLNKLINSPTALDSVRSMGHSPYGIVIVVGPTGSGKSTTLYSILNELNTDEVNISTVEDPVEYTLKGIHQVQVIREKGLDFAKALRSLMRQDPDIILVGETRDKETAQTAMEAALTGHMVFTTLHANDTATAITRLSEMGIPSYLIGASVIGVIAQRLVRRVCLSCSTKRTLDQAKDKLAMSYGIQKARSAKIIIGGGRQSSDKPLCQNCGGSGYKGRVGIYEIMKINDYLRESIMSGSTADVIRNQASQAGLKSLLEYGMDLVKQELTTIEEVERVCLLEME